MADTATLDPQTAAVLTALKGEVGDIGEAQEFGPDMFALDGAALNAAVGRAALKYRTHEGEGESVTAQAAYATAYGKAHNLVYAGTQSQYSAAEWVNMFKPNGAASLGTYWNDLGRCLTVLGVQEGDDNWKLLAGQNGAQLIGAVIRAAGDPETDPKGDLLERGIAAVFDESGKKRSRKDQVANLTALGFAPKGRKPRPNTVDETATQVVIPSTATALECAQTLLAVLVEQSEARAASVADVEAIGERWADVYAAMHATASKGAEEVAKQQQGSARRQRRAG